MNHWYHAVWVLRSSHYLCWDMRGWSLFCRFDFNKYYFTVSFLCLSLSWRRPYYSRLLKKVDLSELGPDD